MAFWKTPKANLTEGEIRYAMANGRTLAQCAAFLGITSAIFVKYAKLYFDPESGKTLHQIIKERPRPKQVRTKRDPLPHGGGRVFIDGHQLAKGIRSSLPGRVAKQRLLDAGEMLDQCKICGYDERRLSDSASPTILVFINGDVRDYRLDNLELICRNCFHTYNYGIVRTKRVHKK